MSKLKKALLTGIAYVAVAALAIGGTVAFLQDEDSDVNVMTLGNVYIEQHEYQRADGVSHINAGAKEGDLVPFVQGQPLYPAVPTADDAYEAEQAADRCFHWGVYSPGWNGLWDDSKLANVMDKFVFVENTGKTDAYYRTLIALECPEGITIGYDDGDKINVNINGNSRFDWDYSVGYITIEGTRYEVWCVTYNNILTPGEVSRPSLLQVVMTHNATNEDMALLGDTYDILVLSQAVQTAGFANAQTALDTAFGKAADKAAEWFGGMKMPTLVNTAAELQTAIDAAQNGDTIVLGADIEGDVTVTQKAGVKITVDGNGKKFAGVITVDGKSATYTTAGLTVKNVNFVADSISADACIRLGNGTNATRYTCNVTVEGCTFDVPGAVGVKSYTGGDKNLTITGCTATANAHSLVQAKGIDGILVENCNVYSKNGLNFNNSDNVTISGCIADVKGYAVRFGESSGGVGAAETYLIKDCNLTSANDDGDATIILRGTADNATLTIVNTTIVGTPDIVNTATGATVVK